MNNIWIICIFAYLNLYTISIGEKIISCFSRCKRENLVLDCTRNITVYPPCLTSPCIRKNFEKFESYQKNVYLFGCAFLPGKLLMPRLDYLYSTAKYPVLLNNSFEGLCSVRYLNLSKNAIKTIESNAFECAESLESIDLSRNELTELPAYLFTSMNRLLRLYVYDNFLTQLSLESLDSLKVLYANKNKLQLFYGNNVPDLRDVVLSDNPELVLDNVTFSNLKGMNALHMKDCNLTHLPHDVFYGNEFLKVVSLSKNFLSRLGSVFSESLYMSRLELDRNEISDLDHKPFRNLRNLKDLDLSFNKLSIVRRNDFEGLLGLNLLNLSHNLIEEVESFSFDSLISMHFLEIDHNRLLTLSGTNVFQHNRQLVYIDVSYNRLTDIKNTNWHLLEFLEIFIAKGNELSELLIPKISSLNSLRLFFERNRIQRVFVDSKNFENKISNQSVKIVLGDNPIECDCDGYNLYRLFNENNNSNRFQFYSGFDRPSVQFYGRLDCQYPARLQGKELFTLAESDFNCDTCHKLCSCEYEISDYVFKKINCSNRDFESVPNIALFNASSLIISQNKLTSLSGLNASHWENLTEIQAGGNKISGGGIYLPKNVKFLGLQNNEMKDFPLVLKKHAEKVKDFKMTLSNNPWSCDCSNYKLKEFLSIHSKQVIDVNDTRCVFNNNSLSSVSMVRMKDSDLCSDVLKISGIIVGATAILILAVSFSVFYYRNKVQIASLFYTHFNFCYTLLCCDRPSNENKPYDCFISYGTEDTEVMLEIIEKLENRPPFLKFCIHERNWAPGEYITNNIIWSVQNSSKTLIVLSKEFAKSKWFRIEFQVAYHQTLEDRRNRIIMVLKGDLPEKDQLDKDVHHVLSTTTYLQWGERWFWEKLRYALHQENIFEENKGKWNLPNLRCCPAERTSSTGTL